MFGFIFDTHRMLGDVGQMSSPVTPPLRRVAGAHDDLVAPPADRFAGSERARLNDRHKPPRANGSSGSRNMAICLSRRIWRPGAANECWPVLERMRPRARLTC
jgi:hypothetical protein